MLASIFEQLGESLVGGGGTEFGWLLGQFLIKRKPDISDTVGRARSFFNALRDVFRRVVLLALFVPHRQPRPVS